jgi:t-SNARE complex subunit (syntaxin)
LGAFREYDERSYDQRVQEVAKQFIGSDGRLSEDAAIKIITDAAGDRVFAERLYAANVRFARENTDLKQQIKNLKNMCNICRSINLDEREG